MDWYTFLIIAHIIGTALGAGGATISDVLFSRTIKKGIISSAEFELFKTISGVIWVGFLILVFSGTGIFIFNRLNLTKLDLIYSPGFLAKITIVIVIFFVGLLMHSKILPLIEKNLNRPLNSPDFLKKISLVVSIGVISIVSWYTALILGVWRYLEVSYFLILSVYAIVIAFGIVIGNVVVKRILTK